MDDVEKKQNIVVLDQNYKLLNQEYWYDLNVLDTRKRVHCASWFKVSFDIANWGSFINVLNEMALKRKWTRWFFFFPEVRYVNKASGGCRVVA